MWTHLRKRRRCYLAGLVLLAAAGLWGTWAARGGGSGVTWRNVERIRPGMSLQEVEDVLGARGALTAIDWSSPGRCTYRWQRQPGLLTAAATVDLDLDDERGVAGVAWAEAPWLPHVWSQLKQRLGF